MIKPVPAVHWQYILSGGIFNNYVFANCIQYVVCASEGILKIGQQGSTTVLGKDIDSDKMERF